MDKIEKAKLLRLRNKIARIRYTNMAFSPIHKDNVDRGYRSILADIEDILPLEKLHTGERVRSQLYEVIVRRDNHDGTFSGQVTNVLDPRAASTVGHYCDGWSKGSFSR